MLARTLPDVEWPQPLDETQLAVRAAGLTHTPSLPTWRAYVGHLAERTNLSPTLARRVEDFAHALSWHADPETRTSRGSWANHGAAAGVSRASVGRYMAVLKALGLLVLVEPGLSGNAWRDRQAASYAFTIPPRETDDEDETRVPKSAAAHPNSSTTETPTMDSPSGGRTIHFARERRRWRAVELARSSHHQGRTPRPRAPSALRERRLSRRQL